MSRTKQILSACNLMFTNGWVETRAEELESAFERFLLIASDQEFAILLQSLERQYNPPTTVAERISQTLEKRESTKG